MSAFTDCIRSAIEAGKVKREKGEEAIQAYEEEIQRGIDSGLTEQAARDAATEKAVEHVGARTAAKKWEKINELRKQHRLYTRLQKTENVPQLMEDLIVETEIVVDRTRNLAFSHLNEFVESSRPRLAGLRHPVRHLDRVVDAAYGMPTKNPADRVMADSIKSVMNFLRQLANREGASIPENENVFLPQQHNTFKVRRAGKTIEESKAIWVKDHLESLDWNLMRYAGREILPNEREEVLGKIFDTIASFGDINIRPGIPQANLVQRLSHQRFLHYKDAASWKAMNKKYGEGNLFQQTVGLVESMSRNVALMERFGPNPANSLGFLFRSAEQKAAAQSLDPKFSGRAKTPQTRTAKAIADFTDQYNLVARNLPNSDESLLANIGGNLRTYVGGSLLTGAYLANLGDLGLMKHTAMMQRLPMSRQLRTYLKMFVPNKKNREMAMQAGLGADAYIQMASALQRMVGPLEGGAWSKMYADVIYRSSFLTAHNQAAKYTAGINIQQFYALARDIEFEELANVEELRRVGIGKEDWDLFRSTEVKDERGLRMLRPIDLYNSTEGDVRRNKRVAEKFMDYVLGYRRFAVPEADAVTLSTLGHTADPKTWRGQLQRSWSMFLAFPTTIIRRHLRRGWQERGVGGKARYLGSFFLTMTAAGAFITQMKELAKGRDPLDMTTGHFWLRSALNGGSFGLLGDAILGPGQLSNIASGAMIGFLQDVKNIGKSSQKAASQFFSGEEIDSGLSKQLISFVSRYGPWLWYMRLLMERHVTDELLKEADPAAYRRKVMREKRRERELNQRSWWRPGEAAPRRAPDFGAAFGGSS